VLVIRPDDGHVRTEICSENLFTGILRRLDKFHASTEKFEEHLLTELLRKPD
jgi:hypothetical protein